MRKPRLSTVCRSLDDLLNDKRQIKQKEQELIGKLNRILADMGYEVSETKAGGTTQRRPRRRRLEPRRSQVALKSAEFDGAPKRKRGRPRLRKVA